MKLFMKSRSKLYWLIYRDPAFPREQALYNSSEEKSLLTGRRFE